MKRARFTIYLHTSPSGRSYIGQTVGSMNVRWKEHVSAAKAGVGCPVLGAAIRKYGEHAFKHEVLDVVTTQRGADIAERVWIEARGTRVPGGYNLEAGGNGHGRVHEITKRRIGEKSKARLAAMTPEQRTAFLRTNILKWTPERRKAQSERTPSVEKAHEAVRKIFAGLTIEERSARVKRMLSGMTQEQLGDRVRKAWANLTPEARAERVRNAQAAGIIAGPRRSKKMSEFQTARQKTLTPEQRSENTRKAWATRRANAAARATASIVDKKK